MAATKLELADGECADCEGTDGEGSYGEGANSESTDADGAGGRATFRDVGGLAEEFHARIVIRVLCDTARC